MRRKLAALLAAVLLAGVLCACAGGDRQEEGLRLWFASALTNENGWTGAAQAVSTVAYTGEENVGSLLAALLAGPPEGSGLVSPFPAGTELLGWKRSGSIIQVTFSAPYGTLTGVEQTVADYNAACAAGKDEQFYKNSYLLRELTGDTFYVIEYEPSIWGTFGGVKTDSYARAVNAEQQPIQGLYVAGVDNGSIYASPYYENEGAALGTAYTSGIVAADCMISDLKNA